MPKKPKKTGRVSKPVHKPQDRAQPGDTEPIMMRRVGEKEFEIEHNDGSRFYCEADSKSRADSMGEGLRRHRGKPPIKSRVFSGFGNGKKTGSCTIEFRDGKKVIIPKKV